MSATIKLEIPADHKYLSVLGAAVSAFAELTDDATLAYGVQLAVHEICANIIDHAYQVHDPLNRIYVQLEMSATQLKTEIMDNGRIFNPQTFAWPLPTTWEINNSETSPIYRLIHIDEPTLDQERGRGMYLVRKLMDELIYAPHAGQNLWRLTKQF